MKAKYDENILSGIFSILKQPKYAAITIITAVVVAFVYSLSYGIVSIPPLFANLRMTPIEFIDYVFVGASSIIIGVLVSLSIYSQAKKSITGKGVSVGSFAAGMIGALCPVCLGLNVLILGSVVTIPLVSLLSYIRVVQVAVLALLGIGLWFGAKNAYENYCIYCEIKVSKPKKKESVSWIVDFSKPVNRYLLYGMLAFAVVFLLLQLIPFTGIVKSSASSTVKVGDHSAQIDINEITAQVLPEEGFTVDAKWDNTVQDMINAGVLDSDKLQNILEKRYGQTLTEDETRILTESNLDEKLTINSKNSVFMMYVLWVLGKHNDNSILHDSPFAQYFDNYDIGVGKAGYGDTKLIELTPEQQEIAEYVGLNSYRPCCGNPTGWPDCSHGFSALGLVELMASQGYSKEEIFDAFVKFNSFWFPSTYIENAVYFKIVNGTDWNDVDRELVAGKDYSSLSGSYKVQSYLKGLGI